MPTVKQLRLQCKRNGIRGYSGKNKAWLINALKENSNARLEMVCKENGIPYRGKKAEWMKEHCIHPTSISKNHTVQDLQKICKRNGTQGYSGKKKKWLEEHCFTPRL